MTCRLRSLFGLCGFVAGTSLAWSMLPLHLPTLCLFRRLTGLPCPSCGLTHAACALAHGRFSEAERFNVAAVPLAVLGAAVVVGLLIEGATNRPCLAPAWQRCRRPLTVAILALLGAAWVFHFVPGSF